MHPGMFGFWKHAQRAAACAMSDCAPGTGDDSWEHGHASVEHDGEFGGGAFGVRRPLRFLAFKLQLSEDQVAELAQVLNELKTERAQAAVDNRRTVTAFADAIASDVLDQGKLGEAGGQRVRSAERVRDAVLKALGRIHGLLDAKQRAQLAYLIRTGALTI